MIWFHPACYPLVFGGSSHIVTRTEYQKTIVVYIAFVKGDILIDPVLGCIVAFMAVFHGRTLSEIRDISKYFDSL